MSREYDWTVDEENRAGRRRTLDTLQEGSVVEGNISNLVDFGAFVDLGPIDGLVHISDLSGTPVDHPSEVVREGEKVRVKVLKIDRDQERVYLGLKQALKENMA